MNGKLFAAIIVLILLAAAGYLWLQQYQTPIAKDFSETIIDSNAEPQQSSGQILPAVVSDTLTGTELSGEFDESGDGSSLVNLQKVKHRLSFANIGSIDHFDYVGAPVSVVGSKGQYAITDENGYTEVVSFVVDILATHPSKVTGTTCVTKTPINGYKLEVCTTADKTQQTFVLYGNKTTQSFKGILISEVGTDKNTPSLVDIQSVKFE